MSDSWRARMAWLLIALNTVGLVVFIVFAGGVGGVIASLLIVVFTAVGGVLTIKQPQNATAWLLLVIGTAWAAAFVLPFEGGWALPLTLTGTQLMLRVPNGSLPSPRWKWFSDATIVLIVLLPFLFSTSNPVSDSSGEANPYYLPWVNVIAPVMLLLPVAILVSAASLVVRYRRAGMVERQQIRWLAWAAATVALIYTIALLSSLNSPWTADTSTALGLLQTAALMSFFLIPVAIGIAVLKYRLYDIDRLISRTTSYAVVTGLLIATYGVVVTLVSRLLPDSSTLAVAAATLASAAAFRPLLRRVQTAVDKRFNRERYNAVQMVDAFATRLRDVVDADAVADDFVTAVQGALQPSHVTVWLTDVAATGGGGRSLAASHSASESVN